MYASFASLALCATFQGALDFFASPRSLTNSNSSKILEPERLGLRFKLRTKCYHLLNLIGSKIPPSLSLSIQLPIFLTLAPVSPELKEVTDGPL